MTETAILRVHQCLCSEHLCRSLDAGIKSVGMDALFVRSHFDPVVETWVSKIAPQFSMMALHHHPL
jgi:hypothetical protein